VQVTRWPSGVNQWEVLEVLSRHIITSYTFYTVILNNKLMLLQTKKVKVFKITTAYHNEYVGEEALLGHATSLFTLKCASNVELFALKRYAASLDAYNLLCYDLCHLMTVSTALSLIEPILCTCFIILLKTY
jgi:hypothetical protein